MKSEEEIKRAVREKYAAIVHESASSCCGPSTCGCGTTIQDQSKKIGYSAQELNSVPAGADLGLGCGNPVALASLKEGDVVLDLGAGAGIDCFLAAEKIGANGKVIGVDMTPDMVSRARENAAKSGLNNIEFRLGEIENLPVADKSVDIIISNCVINLVPDKRRVFEEAFRVLKPGGRLMISDMVLLKKLPETIMNSIEAYVGCLSGAVMRDEYLSIIGGAGFTGVKVMEETVYPVESILTDPFAAEIANKAGITSETIKELAVSVVSIKVAAVRPARKRRAAEQ